MSGNLDLIVKERAEKWLSGNYDEDTKKQVKYLMDNNLGELTESFYKDLEFGTGGLRGIMGVGTNRMNVYTVGMATQGLVELPEKSLLRRKQIKRRYRARQPQQQPAVFAERVADIFAANGFKVYLFDSLRPTPGAELRHPSSWNATAAWSSPPRTTRKSITATKRTGTDGAQVVAPHDRNIIAEVQKDHVARTRCMTRQRDTKRQHRHSGRDVRRRSTWTPFIRTVAVARCHRPPTTT